jgi:NB-ARC domain
MAATLDHFATTAIEKSLTPQPDELRTVKAPINTNTKQHVPQKSPPVEVHKDDSGTRAISGDDYKVPKPRSGWPKVGNVERAGLVESMSAFLLQGDRSRRKLAVLSGLSGYGKTQVAVFFADKYEKEFDSFLYVNAATLQTIEQSMASRLDDIWNSWKDRPKTKPEDSKTIIATVKQWLSLDTNNKWLLIFDNVNKYVEGSYDIRNYMPKTKNGGTVIITTQHRQDYDNGPSSIKYDQLEAKTFDVLGMTPEEGNTLLTSLGFPTNLRNRIDGELGQDHVEISLNHFSKGKSC